MIVSASYRTDIPAYYGRWFMRRLDAGWCRVANPYGGAPGRIRLDPGHVSGFVFWTKNLAPFAESLAEIRARGFPFVVHYTINRYPAALERAAGDARRAVAEMHDLARAFGPRAAVWRYDPVIATSLTPLDWHVENFRGLAASLEGAADEVVISFAHIYRKTRRKLEAAARASAFAWRDPAAADKRALAGELAAIAAARGMRLTLCAQPEFLVSGAAAARCIDADRLADVAGRAVTARLKGNRPGCGCFESRDIGAYDSCPTGCVYCYAVRSRAAAQKARRAHAADGASLLPPAAG